MEIFRRIFKRKPKPKAEKVKEVLVLDEDKTFENEVKKLEVKSETRETKSETTSSLTFGE